MRSFISCAEARRDMQGFLNKAAQCEREVTSLAMIGDWHGARAKQIEAESWMLDALEAEAFITHNK